MLDSLLGVPPPPESLERRHPAFSVEGNEPSGVSPRADAASLALLSRILAHAGCARTPIIQLLPCGRDGSASSVAEGLAVAATTRLGRSLLIESARMPDVSGLEGGGATEFPTSRDAMVASLHRAQMGCFLLDRRDGGDRIRAMLSAAATSFRFVTLDTTFPGDSPDSLALAPMCHGTVLVVQAGRTLMADVHATARDVAAAKGHVLGTVLTQVPAYLPAWLRAGCSP